MTSVKILMMISYHPDEKNVMTDLAKRILSSLRKKCDAELIWILSSSQKVSNKKFQNISIFNMQKYQNACEIIDVEKPDAIIVIPSFSYTNFPLIIAGRYKKVPVITCELYGLLSIGNALENHTRFEMFLSKIRRFFGKINNSKHSSSKIKGSFYIYKYKFLFNTLKAAKYSKIQLFKNILENIWVNFLGIIDKNIFDLQLLTDKICLATSDSEKNYLNSGFPKDILHVTGSPLFDDYQIDKIPIKNHLNKKKYKILIVTLPLSTHGMISKNEQYSLIVKLATVLKENKIDFAIKIHPSSESLDEYQETLKNAKIDCAIFQKESLSELLKDFDIGISFGVYSTALIDILFSGIPLVLINTSERIRKLLVVPKIAIECSDPNKIINQIESIKDNRLNKKSIEHFLKNTSYPLDGMASERISSIILSLIKN